MDEQQFDSVPGEGSSVDDVALSQLKDQNTGCDMTPQLLDALQDELSRCCKAPVQMEHVMDSIGSSSVDPSKLLNFFKFYNDLQKEKGGNQRNTSEVSRDEGESGLTNPPISECSQHIDVSGKTSLSSFWKSTVRVYPSVSGFTCGVEQVIMGKLPSMRLTVKFTKDWRDSDVTLLFCPITTRPGADVDAAMRKLQGDKPVILVAMYHTLDTDFSADLRRWSSIYENVVFDIDVLFHETVPGLLKCPQNEQVAQKIYKTLTKYKK